MAFHLQHVAVPFRMQPGLQRLADDAHHLTPLLADTPLWHEKRAVWASGQSRLCVPGFDPRPALEAIAAQAAREGLASTPRDPDHPLELCFEEDFALLDGASGTVPWMCLCVPSHWAPEDKIGQDLGAIHSPVADSQLLRAATAALVKLATGGGHWERFVWTITPSARYDQHPRRHTRTPWPTVAQPGTSADDDVFTAQCHLRAERQTFLPVPGTAQAVFTIRVMLQPLTSALATPEDAGRLHDALASMSDAVVQYKGLAAARPILLRWLARCATGSN